MKKLVSFLVSAALAAIFLISKIIEMSSQQSMLMYSLLPLLAILEGYNRVRFTFREIRRQSFRLTVYGLSGAMFLICLISYFGVIPITHVVPGMSQLRRLAFLFVGVMIVLLMLVNIAISMRDSDRRDKGWPL